ncbi:Spermidine/putrescine import ATP-binding protein PotA [Thalassovita gelatinovora]|uniref:Spermidine/putrescine import ATP-binding protein PotA n=1 Tax=Thalassovita gelatinovora TaxID=53501 RepID=A0A0N7LUH5_THAGE|nr:ABC transporter ATP-binding protein [Thalassovita gelatinovora]QIZ80977.1 ABC transporter ATP-binding protein [Thalassovita gelatinovora]CUH63514.1 Spermidine/putrescine import ATP-binding protein PotA [Thalassovita gelatinovora]SEQ68483.1 putrescine transport system ATP-binding protein [Thalassovita gelatinovora]
MTQTVFAPWEDPGEKPLIQFKNVTKRFGSFTAIDNLTQDIYEREFFALLGPSGCGKTTMMRMLAGFEEVTEGQILLAGQDMARVPPNERAVNMMFQSYALFPHLSVWENIAFGLKRKKMPKSELDARVDEMLRLTRLERFARRKPHQISGGQRQRVALARSLARAPKLLLLDEPLGALDKKLRQDTQFELMDIQEKTGTTFVIVTHDQEESMTVASRVAVMDEGQIIQVATPDKIYEEPASLYVADFIGDVNIIEGIATKSGEDGYKINWSEGKEPFQAKTPRTLSEGQKAYIAIRPEKIAVSQDKPDSALNSIKGKIVDIAYLGNMSTYHVEIPGGLTIKAQTANTRRLSRRSFTWEDEVWLSWTLTAGSVLER